MSDIGSAGAALERLANIMRKLRAPDGCPWDREQDLKSLRPYLIEEAYEVLEEMDRVSAGGPWAPLAEELGDLLFQIVFHAQLADELGHFTLADVANSIADKLERRHPHVFGDAVAKNSTQVLESWAKLKAKERKAKHGAEGSVLDGVPRDAPGLQRAERLTEKASRIGFDWPDVQGVVEKIDEEVGELKEALASKDHAAMEHELGDALFALANLGRKLGIPPRGRDARRQPPLHHPLPRRRAGPRRAGRALRRGHAGPDGRAVGPGQGRREVEVIHLDRVGLGR